MTMENRKHPSRKNTCFLILLSSFFLVSLVLFLSTHPLWYPSNTTNVRSTYQTGTPRPVSSIPRLAYLISGSKGDGKALERTLKAIYHPMNQYILHLDREAPAKEKRELINNVKNEPVFKKVGNVRVVKKSNLVTYRGITMVTNTLHAAAILLKHGGEWDWFINLSASDYPLVTQDDMLHTFSNIPRDFNFIEHTSDLGWKEKIRAEPIVIDPGLHNVNKTDFDVIQLKASRNLPTAFKLFTGSAWMMLSRPFVEFCLLGWDNLPRIVLSYYTNFLSSPEGYFQTVICNTEEFRNTTVNHDLHFISWDHPPKQHPHHISIDEFPRLVKSNAPFARKFGKDKKLFDMIDSQLLGREAGGFVKSGWFDGVKKDGFDPRYAVRDVSELRPGPGAERLRNLTTRLISDKNSHANHCI